MKKSFRALGWCMVVTLFARTVACEDPTLRFHSNLGKGPGLQESPAHRKPNTAGLRKLLGFREVRNIPYTL